MEKVKIRIKIEFEDESGQIIEDHEQVEFLASDLDSLDVCESHLLKTSYETMRSALGKHLSWVSKKKR